MNLFCLGADQIDGLWDEYCEHIHHMERLGYLNANEIRSELKLAKKQLWGVQDDGRVLGIAITRIGGQCCEIYAAVGAQSAPGQITSLYDRIESWARAIGCTRMRVIGRKGWIRMLPGYEQTGVVLEKELDDEHE